jgi:hypothetical protein
MLVFLPLTPPERVGFSDGKEAGLPWEFRASQSPDGNQIVFCRATTGEPPAIWVMDNDGGNARALTRGIEDQGADHPRWIGNP